MVSGSRTFTPVWVFAVFGKTISNAGQASISGSFFRAEKGCLRFLAAGDHDAIRRLLKGI
jgi:hypothetical protein